MKARKEVSLPAIEKKSGTQRLESNLPKELLNKIDGNKSHMTNKSVSNQKTV